MALRVSCVDRRRGSVRQLCRPSPWLCQEQDQLRQCVSCVDRRRGSVHQLCRPSPWLCQEQDQLRQCVSCVDRRRGSVRQLCRPSPWLCQEQDQLRQCVSCVDRRRGSVRQLCRPSPWLCQEQDQLRRANERMSDEVLQQHALKEKRLPKLQKETAKTRSMQFKQSLRLSQAIAPEMERERIRQVGNTGDTLPTEALNHLNPAELRQNNLFYLYSPIKCVHKRVCSVFCM